LLLAGKLKLVRDYTIIVSPQQRVSAGLRDLCEGRWHADQEHGSSDQIAREMLEILSIGENSVVAELS
jgi:hypothetical protein